MRIDIIRPAALLAPMLALAGLLLMLCGGAVFIAEIGLLSTRTDWRVTAASQRLPDPVRLAMLRAAVPLDSAWREDVIALRVGAEAMALRGLRGTAAVATARQSLEDSARALAAASPLSGLAWCTLAQIEVQRMGYSDRAEALLEHCYRVAPRELAAIEARLDLSMLVWPLLPLRMQNASLADIANVLGDDSMAIWMADRLARLAVLAAPERALLIEQMMRHYGAKSAVAFERAKLGYGRLATWRPDEAPPRLRAPMK